MEIKRAVLVVDDQSINRKILEKILSNDYIVYLAESGMEAMEILAEKGSIISAVLLDIMMLIMSGYDVLTEMGRNPLLAKIPVLVTSQADGDESELKALNYGASDFVSKPYNADILKKRLHNLIQMYEATTAVGILEKDELTGLYSKEGFLHNIADELRRTKNAHYDVVSLDIENFKLVNDIYGMEEGNKLLLFLADIINNIVGKEDIVCARVYADQFLILLPYAESCVEELHREIQTRIKEFPIDMMIHMKMGIYHISDVKIDVNAMCDRAVMAANSIKGNYDVDIAYYDDSFREKMLYEQQITNYMEEALKTKQFQVYFQPKYQLESEKMAGAEALVRWIHPEEGFMSRGEFIPLFEKNGFITELDTFVWEETCRKIALWIETYGKYVPVSVNVSRKDIYKQDLPILLLNIVHKYGLEPKHLHLEITESAYTENPEQLISVVGKLKEEGFVIEMDDFGSGYSSLNMLAELPIDILKLDMKFVQNKGPHSKNESIMSCMIELAKKIDLIVVAEGVEEQKQIDMLREMKCDIVQGYYFSKPLPADDFEKRLEIEEVIAGQEVK